MRGRVLAGLPILAILGLVAPASAAAAQRYVSPSGSGTTCTAVAPCSLATGVSSAGAGDEVIVTPGTYSTAANLQNFNGISVHGQAGMPRPLLNMSSGSGGLALAGAGAYVADLSINYTGSSIALQVGGNGVSAERVDVLSAGSIACQVGYGGVLRDSLCKVTSNSGQAFNYNAGGGGSTLALKLRNVTAAAPGGSATAIYVDAGDNVSIDVSLKNVIAYGGASDVAGNETATASNLSIVAEYSNYDVTNPCPACSITAPGSGTNQTAAPVFADTVGYHQAPSSPTVDAGTVDADTGSKDLDGDARPQGAAMDIGVDELVPAAPPDTDTTPPDTRITKHPKKKTRSRKARFAFSSSEAGSTFECKLDKGIYRPCASPIVLRHLKRRRHKFFVRATDAAGNTDASPATYRWRVKKKRR